MRTGFRSLFREPEEAFVLLDRKRTNAVVAGAAVRRPR